MTYAINGIFGNMGEVCNAGSRLLIDRPIAEEFLARFIERGKTMYRAGDPLDPTTNLGSAGDGIASRAGHELHRPRQDRGGRGWNSAVLRRTCPARSSIPRCSPA